MTFAFTLCGRRGTYGTGLALAARLVSHGAVTPRRFAWQARHFETSAFTLCGRRGTSWHLPSLCVAGVAAVALGDIHLRFTWQAWHFVTSTLSSHHLSSHYLSAHNLSSHYLSTHNLSTCHHTTCVFTLLVHTQLTHTQLVIRPHLITPLVITPLVFTLLVFTLLVHRATKKRSRSWQIRTVSAQSVATILVLLAFSGSYIAALAAVAWQVHHAAMSWSLLVLLQLTVLICLLSICASETNSFGDSRCFLLFCEAPTSSRRCCCSIHAYIHTYIQTYIQTYIHTFIHTYIHSCMHACIHAYTTYSYRSIRACYCERAGAVWGDLMLLD